MSNENDNYNNNFEEIDLELKVKLRNEGIVQRFVKNIKHNYLKIELNHKYEKNNVVVSTANIRDWSKFHDTLKKMLNFKGVYDQEHIRLILDTVDDNFELVIENNDNFGQQYSSSDLNQQIQEAKEEEGEKRK